MKKYKIETVHNIYVDSYSEGEKEYCNCYDISHEIKADNVKNAIKKYFDEVLCYNLDFELSQIDGENENILHYSVLVDSQNSEVKIGSIDYHKWKENKKTLYANYIEVYVYELKEISLTDKL